MSRKAKRDYWLGIKTGIPVLFGFVPVGIAYAIMAGQAGFSVSETILMSVLVFAGASQMMAVGMYAQGVGLLAIILATFILNLRHLIMSTCVLNRMKAAKMTTKLLAAFGVTDESFAIFTTIREEKATVWFYFGLITVTYSSWVGGSVLGALLSGFLPEIVTASFGIALYAMFIALIIPGLRGNGRLIVLAIFTGFLNWLLVQVLPSSWALIGATLIGAFLGVFFVDLEKGQSKEDV